VTGGGDAPRVTIGVAIHIPQPHATVLSGWRRRVGDPQAEQVWPHVTLLPPTEVGESALPEIDAHLAAVAASASDFVVHLAGTGTFRPVSPVVFVQVARGVEECERLELGIRSGPLGRDLEFPYHPHVTVAQEVGDAALDEAYEGLSGFVARFGVSSFELFVRRADGGWDRRAEFMLGAAHEH
jgi:2'-5' RNA ligase